MNYRPTWKWRPYTSKHVAGILTAIRAIWNELDKEDGLKAWDGPDTNSSGDKW